ncbi:MAG: dockerin type I domain-containing protein [Planctomycetota bacterium]|jgi:hypothetical protein
MNQVVTALAVAVVASAAQADPVVYTDSWAFAAAVAELGEPTVIEFDDIGAPPGDTYVGRDPFPGDHYAAQGIIFSNPNDYPMFVAPGGLFWNASNSLSIGAFPFDPQQPNPFRDDDDLVVTLDPPCQAVGLTLVDSDANQPNESIQFIDAQGHVVVQAPLPPDFTDFRAFIGVVSPDQPIAAVNIVEAADDGDDINYDDFILFPGVVTIPCPADLDGNGTVGVSDLLIVIGNWGDCPGGPCVWDVNGDGVVDESDLHQVNDNFGPCDGCPEDVNSDGMVDGQDAAAVATHFGPCP